MEAVLTAYALKPFTKALIALSKYGDDLDIHATPESLSLCSTNSSKSAYGRFRLLPHFFEKYTVGDQFKAKARADEGADEDGIEEVERVDGQVLVKVSSDLPFLVIKGRTVINSVIPLSLGGKSILSILKHKTFEKTVESCEFSIIPGHESIQSTADTSSTARGGLGSSSSILLVRLYCQHGVTKTHRLALNAPPVFMAPQLPMTHARSSVVVGPRAVKDLVDHFARSKGKGTRAGDVQLIWEWYDGEVSVKTLKGVSDRNAEAHISTSITVHADEFDSYDIPHPPISLSFHLREFIAATGLAESLSLQLNLSFTIAAEPLSITIESETYESLFVIATKSIPGGAAATHAPPPAEGSSANKRPRESADTAERRKSMKVVTVEPNLAAAMPSSTSRRVADDSRSSSGSRSPEKSPSRSASGYLSDRLPSQPPVAGPSGGHVSGSTSTLRSSVPSNTPTLSSRPIRPPLFLPMSQPDAPPIAHLSQQDQEMIRASGLGIEGMTSTELADLLDYDGEEDQLLETSPVKAKPASSSTSTSLKSFNKAGVKPRRELSPEWDLSEDLENSRIASQSETMGRGSSSVRLGGMGLSEEESVEIEMDRVADADEEMLDQDSLPLTQLSLVAVKRGNKVYRPL